MSPSDLQLTPTPGDGPQAGITIQSALMIGVAVVGMAAALRLPWRYDAAPEPALAATASEAGIVQA